MSEPLETDVRPWGRYEVLVEDQGYKVKRITVNPGGILSLQYHHHRSEHWIIVAGTATVTKGEEKITLKANESVYLPQGIHHRIQNDGDEPVIFIEVQTGSYLGEDDIIRIEDKYSRV